jgi:hypothetical protein
MLDAREGSVHTMRGQLNDAGGCPRPMETIGGRGGPCRQCGKPSGRQAFPFGKMGNHIYAYFPTTFCGDCFSTLCRQRSKIRQSSDESDGRGHLHGPRVHPAYEAGYLTMTEIEVTADRADIHQRRSCQAYLCQDHAFGTTFGHNSQDQLLAPPSAASPSPSTPGAPPGTTSGADGDHHHLAELSPPPASCFPPTHEHFHDMVLTPTSPHGGPPGTEIRRVPDDDPREPPSSHTMGPLTASPGGDPPIEVQSQILQADADRQSRGTRLQEELQLVQKFIARLEEARGELLEIDVSDAPARDLAHYGYLAALTRARGTQAPPHPGGPPCGQAPPRPGGPPFSSYPYPPRPQTEQPVAMVSLRPDRSRSRDRSRRP